MLVSILILIAFLISIRKVYYGSKSQFAYVLLFFTLGYSFNYFTYYLTLISNNFKTYTVSEYFYYLLSIQVWVFSIMYFKSGQQSKEKQMSFSEAQWQILTYSVIFCYVLALIILCTYVLVSCPGTSSPDVYYQWYATTDRYLYYTTKGLWSLLNMVSSTLTVIGILQIN